MNNWVTRFVMVLIAVAMYFNVGWAIGTYYHNYIFGHEPQTFWQHIWYAKGFTHGNMNIQPLLTDQIFFMIVWPFPIIFSLIEWIVYGIYYIIYYILWLVFGGVAKLLGVG